MAIQSPMLPCGHNNCFESIRNALNARQIPTCQTCKIGITALKTINSNEEKDLNARLTDRQTIQMHENNEESLPVYTAAAFVGGFVISRLLYYYQIV